MVAEQEKKDFFWDRDIGVDEVLPVEDLDKSAYRRLNLFHEAASLVHRQAARRGDELGEDPLSAGADKPEVVPIGIDGSYGRSVCSAGSTWLVRLGSHRCGGRQEANSPSIPVP